MTINIISSYKNAKDAKGLTVVVDVLRAHTTFCYAFNNGAKKIIIARSITQARNLSKMNPNYILIGEKKGIKIKGFNFGNSPTEIKNVDFKNKTLVAITSFGTKGIIKSINSSEILTGAFVNAQAIINFIKSKQQNQLTFILTDNNYVDGEDYLFANYIINALDGNILDFNDIKKSFSNHPTSKSFLLNPISIYSQNDYHLCLELDKFNFVLCAKKVNDIVYLERI